MARDNFPVFAGCSQTVGLSPRQRCGAMIQKTIFAISNEESRYTLNGALLLLKPESASMVATDGHRLAIVGARCAGPGIEK